MSTDTCFMRKLALALPCIAVLAQCTPQQPLEIRDRATISSHRLFQLAPVRTLGACIMDNLEANEGGYYARAWMALSIDQAGRVQTASIFPDAGELALANVGRRACVQQVRALAANWRYQPFQRNGRVVPAIMREPVIAVAPVRWRDPRRVFPATSDPSSAHIVLERYIGLATCERTRIINYVVELNGDGSVRYRATRHVGSWESPRSVTEHEEGLVGSAAFSDLLTKLRNADFFSMRDVYAYGLTDQPGFQIRVTVSGQQARVSYYVGEAAGAPDSLKPLSDEIDRAAATERWIGADCARVFQSTAMTP